MQKDELVSGLVALLGDEYTVTEDAGELAVEHAECGRICWVDSEAQMLNRQLFAMFPPGLHTDDEGDTLCEAGVEGIHDEFATEWEAAGFTLHEAGDLSKLGDDECVVVVAEKPYQTIGDLAESIRWLTGRCVNMEIDQL